MRKLRRRPDRALVGGVCAGFADYLDVTPLTVRIVYLAVALGTGVGVLIYPVAWALMAPPPLESEPPRRSWRERVSGWREAIAIVLLAGFVVLVLRHAGLWLGGQLLLPIVLASVGVALIVRPTPATAGDEHRRWGPARLKDGWRSWPGGLLGGMLVLTGAAVYLGQHAMLRQAHYPTGGVIVAAVAVVLVFGPWLARLGRSLADERAVRIRSQERADVAAHLHDSVLQTLALIQRRADDPRQVATLARRQERELRQWLFERREGETDATLATALERVAGETESLYDVRVETASAGDCPLDERVAAVVAAAREALTNAAKFAGQDRIDLFSEVADGTVGVYVRDRGVGFDPGDVPDDRRGVRYSIVERMAKHGGSAEIRSEPGHGTEVELRIGVQSS